MKKQVATLLTVVFLVSLSLNANAAVKPGTTCKKLGQTSISSGKKYICIKSGRKLVWDKGQSLPKTSPTRATNTSLKNLQSKPGLIAEYYDQYFAFNPDWFESARATRSFVASQKLEYSSQPQEVNYSIQWIGYFTPNETGNWTFQIDTSDRATNFWIGKDAVNNFNSDSSLVIVKAKPTPITSRFTFTLKGGISYPIRLQFGSAGNNGFVKFKVTSPDKTTYEDLSAFTKHFTNLQDRPLGFSKSFNQVNEAQFALEQMASNPTPTSSPTPSTSPTPNPIQSPSATPSITPTPTLLDQTFKPWSTDFSLDKMVAKAHLNWELWEKTNTLSTTKHKILIDERVPIDLVEKIKKVNTYTAQLLSRYISKNTYTLIGYDCDWIKNKLQEIGPIEIPAPITSCEVVNYSLTYMHNSNNFTAIMTQGASISSLSMPGGGSTLSHEFFHGVQVNLVGKLGEHYELTNIPRWFLEGSASYFGYAIWCHTENVDCLKLDAQMLSGQASQPTSYTNDLRDYESTSSHRGDSDFLYPYDIGYRAIQYLAASTGTQSILNILSNMQITHDFSKSFLNVTQLSLSDFYTKFMLSRSSIEFPPATMKLNGKQNQPNP